MLLDLFSLWQKNHAIRFGVIVAQLFKEKIKLLYTPLQWSGVCWHIIVTEIQ